MTVLADKRSHARRKSAWFAAVLFWLAVALAETWNPGCVPDAVPRAKARMKAGDLVGAERIVRSGLARHGDSLDLWVLRLRIDLLKEQRADLVQVLQRLRKLATWHEWKRIRKMVFAHTIWEALGREKGRIVGLEQARRYRFASLKERLEDLLAQGSARQRAMAAGALMPAAPAAIGVLEDLAASRDDQVRMEVAKGLVGTWSERTWKLVIRLCDDPEAAVRAVALGAAAGFMTRGGGARGRRQNIVALLVAHLRDPAGMVRSVAARALEKWAPRELSRLVSADPELAVRLAGLQAGRRDREFLLSQVRSHKPFVSLRAAVMLWKAGFVGGGDVVLHWMSDGQWQVRAAACNAASVMKGSEKACRAVTQALGDRDRRVQAAACGAGLYLGCKKRETLAVCRKLASGEGLPAAAAAWDLARRGRGFGLRRLEALASRPGPGRLAAMRSLAQLRKGLGAMMSCWRTGPWSCRLAAARLLYEKFQQSPVQ